MILEEPNDGFLARPQRIGADVAARHIAARDPNVIGSDLCL